MNELWGERVVSIERAIFRERRHTAFASTGLRRPCFSAFCDTLGLAGVVFRDIEALGEIWVRVRFVHPGSRGVARAYEKVDERFVRSGLPDGRPGTECVGGAESPVVAGVI